MAFALGTTAGAGTISIVAGGTVVTGSGTNFVAANVGAILVVGAQWGVIATRTSTTSVTLDRPFATAVTGSAYTISANIPVITQTGTDTSLSGLTGVPGVTVSPSTSSILYTITSATLVVSGSLIYNRLLNRLRFLNSASILTGSTSLPAMRITGTFNNSVSQSINGYSFKSPSYAILFESNPTSNSGAGNFIGTTSTSTSVFEGNIEFNLSTGTSPQTFVLEGNTTLQNGSLINVTVSGFNVQFTTTAVASTLTVNNYNSYGCGMRVLGNTTNINNYLSVGAAGAINQASSAAVNNPIYEGLQDGGGSIGWRTVNNSLKYFQLLNFASSRSSLIGLAQGNATANSQTLQTNSLIVTAQDSTGVVQDMKLWAKDSNNGNRCSANYGAGLGFEIATTGDLTYTGLTNASGVATFSSIISAIYWQVASGVNASYKVDYRGNGGATSQNLIFYACSYNHNLAQQSPDMWAFNNATGLYNTSTSKAATYLLLADTSITQTDPTIVAAYTTLNNNAELYDFAKYYLYTNFAGQTATYVTGTGDAGSYNVIINQSAANVFTPTGSSIAIKTDNFSGNLTTSGSVILANGSILSNNTVSAPNVLQDIPTNLSGVTITGNLTYNTNTAITVQLTDCDIQGTVSNTGSAQVNIVKVNSTIGTVGTNVVAQQFATVSAPNLIAGSRVRVYDEDNSVELFNGVLASGGFSQSFVYDGDITVTLTAAYVNGATAKLGVSTTGLLTASGVTFLDAQDDDLVYNANGIDGTTVTEFSLDYPNVQVDINDPDGATTITRLYAWWASERTTEDGIRTLIGGLIAEDAANYKVITSVVDLKLDNVAATGVIFTGDVRLYRDDGLPPVVASTTGGGSITLYAGKVYTSIVSTDSLVITGDIADVAPSVWNAVLASYQTAGSTGAALDDAAAAGGATAQEVWEYATRTLTASSDPSAATIAAQVRTELTTELERIDATVSSRNATAPDNAGIAAIKAKTDLVTITGGYVEAVAKSVEDKVGYSLTSGERVAVATAVEAALLNEGDGQQLIDAIVQAIGNQNVDQIALVAAIRADIERAGGSLAGVKAKTDLLPADPAGVSDLPSEAPTVSAIADAVWDEPYAEHTDAGTMGKLMDIFRKQSRAIDGQITGSPTVSVIPTNLTDYPDGAFNHEIAIVNGLGIARPILTFIGGVITLQEPLPVAPDAGDDIIILPAHVHPISEIQEGLATKDDLTVVNDGVKKASILVPHSDDIAD
jgi:hypothetical protein